LILKPIISSAADRLESLRFFIKDYAHPETTTQLTRAR
jgi:hypothetical protein